MTATRTRKPTPAVCLCRPVYHCELIPRGQAGLVQVQGEDYALYCHGASPEDGYRMVKIASGATYDIDVSSGVPLCDCADCTYRQRLCKHGAAIVQFREEGVV